MCLMRESSVTRVQKIAKIVVTDNIKFPRFHVALRLVGRLLKEIKNDVCPFGKDVLVPGSDLFQTIDVIRGRIVALVVEVCVENS